jgi:4a-hydroxytetrahydrobiopterin dehydratase
MTDVLSQDQLLAALAGVPGAHHAGIGRIAVRTRSRSFPDAVRLVTAVADVAEELDHHPDVDLRWTAATFTLSTHSAGGVTELDLDLARRILTLAAETGAEVLPPAPRVEVAIDAADRAALLPFWRTGLGYVEQRTPSGATELHHPDGAGPVVWFQAMDPARAGRGRIHLDVYLPAAEAEQRVADTVAAGGTVTSDAHAPGWWVLADPEGNELCICT